MLKLQLTLALLALGAVALPVSGCGPTDQEYERVNESTDCLAVVVSPDDDPADDDDSAGDDDDSAGDDDDGAEAMIDLVARVGYFDLDVIGTATVSPTRGPAGARFVVLVALEDTGTEQGNPTDVVDRATVRVDNGSVSLNEFEMEESPADESRWVLTLEAGGDPATSRRTDELCVALYTEI